MTEVDARGQTITVNATVIHPDGGAWTVVSVTAAGTGFVVIRNVFDGIRTEYSDRLVLCATPDAGGVPSAHASTHGHGGSDIVAAAKLWDGVSTELTISAIADLGAVVRSGTSITSLPLTGFEFVVNRNTAGGYAALDGSTKLTGSQQVYGSSANTACEGNDSRLSNARAPSGSAGGDLTGTYPNPTLAAAGPGATGPLGGATVAPIVTIDAKGRVTALSSATITGTVPGGSAGGDLSGTYPNPTIGTDKVVTAKIKDANVTLAKVVDGSACSVLARAANSSGVHASLAAAADNQFLVRRSSALAFGGLIAGDIPAHASTHAAAAGSDPLKWRDVFYYRGQHFDHDEFTATSLPGWSQATGSGGGAYQTETTYSAQDVDHCGIVRVDTGATSGGYCHLYRSTVSHLLGSGWVFEAIVQLRNDNTGFIARIGWGDATGGADHTDGAYFEYDKATSANWRIVTASNSTRNKQTTSTAVTFSTWIRLKIVWNSATDVQFYVNGTSVGSSTSGTGGTGTWPTASGRDCGVQFFAKNGATSAFSCIDIDYFECYRDVSR